MEERIRAAATESVAMEIEEIAAMSDQRRATHVALEAPGPTVVEPCDVPMRVPVPVRVTHYSGPTKLSLRYHLLAGVSSEDFHIAPGRRHVYEAAIGMFCMVRKDSSTRGALRALVTDVHRSRGIPVMVEVLYVDSGGTGAVRLDAVYPIDADAAAEPLRAVSCCIRNVTPTTASSGLDLQELCKDGQPLYEALFCDVTDAGVYVVDLYAKLPRGRAAGPSKLDVGEFLVRHGYAERFKDPLAAVVGKPANRVGAWQAESYQNGESDRPSLSLLPVHAEDPTGDIFLPESEAKSAPRENSFEIKVTFTCSPGHFYGQKSCTAKKLCDVHSIARTCTTRLCPEGKARKGTYQIYRESPQETGARVRIEDVLECGKCKVFMIDYGNRKTVSASCLYRPDPSLFRIEPLALRFELAGVAPRRQWTEAAVSRFLELTRSDSPLTAEVVGTRSCCHDEFNDTVYVVKLFSKVHGSVAECMAFDPMREDYDSPLNSYRVNTDDPGVAASNFAAARSHRVCKFYAARGSCRQGDRCTYSHVSAEPGSALLHVTEPVVDPVQTLAPPEVGVRVLGHVSAYASPSCFYLVFPHGRRSLDRLADEGPPDSGGETLATLMAELQRCARAGFDENRLVVRAQGELVAAQSSGDGRWYRAQVVTAEEGDLVAVFFVDFGFSERVPAAQVKSLHPRFTHLPLQALEACLADDDPESSSESSEAFEDCVSGRDLMVEVVRVVQGVLHVRLFFVQDGNLCSVRDCIKKPQNVE